MPTDPTPTDLPIAVLGANGHTARFVIRELQRRGARVLAATRSGRWSPDGTREEHCAVLDFTDETSLDRALAGARAVINCAGPFLDTAQPAARAAIRAGIAYLDLTAEQMAARALFEELGEPASAAGVCLVPAMGFYGALADLLTSAIAPPGAAIDAIEIAVGLDSWHPTQGTRRTGARNTHPRLVVREGALAPLPERYARSQWAFPGELGTQPVAGVQLSEIVLISRHIRANAVTSYMNLKPLADLGDTTTPPPQASGPQGHSDQRFVMDVTLRTTDGLAARAVATGHDIYAATAPLVVTACLDLCQASPAQGGVHAPGALFEPRAFLSRLAPAIAVTYA